MKYLMKSLVVMAMCTHLSSAEIIIAPPPLAYSPLKEIGSQNSVSINYLNFTTDEYDTSGYGVGYAQRVRKTEDTFHNFSVYVMYLGGESKTSVNKSDTYIYNFAYQYGKNLTPELIGFVGTSLNYSSYENYVPIGSTGSDTYIDTVMYSLNAGLQYEHKVSFGAIIPWTALTYVLGGSSDIEIIGATNSFNTVELDSFTAYQLGFDVYFDAIATSLSSMYQSSETGDLISLNMNYNF